MRIYEHEAKELLRKAGVPTPVSHLADTWEEVRLVAQSLGKPVVLKPQTLLKARAKAGLIAFANTPEEASQAAQSLLGRIHQGETIQQILVEEKADPLVEMYLGIAVDYTYGRPTLIGSPSGGVDVEEIVANRPDLLFRVAIPPSTGLSSAQAADLGRFFAKSLPQAEADAEAELQNIGMALYQVFTESDAEMAEINPLVIAKDGRFIALDAAISIDEDALFRHPEFVRRRGESEEEYLRQNDYRQRGWTYLKMDGDIGILSSGAGITMAILDIMRAESGRPANFLDTAQMDRKGIYDAFKIFHGDPTIKTVLVNIFAGLNRCDDLAEGIKDFLIEFSPTFSVVVRMIGNREEQGKEILHSIGIHAISGLEEAVMKAIEVNRGQK